MGSVKEVKDFGFAAKCESTWVMHAKRARRESREVLVGLQRYSLI